jgi:O-antigen ligase
MQSPRDADFMLNLSRRLVYLGMFMLPLLSLRAAKTLSFSDLIFAISAIILVMSLRVPRVPSAPLWYVGTFLVVVSGVVASYVADSTIGSIVVVFNGIYVLVVWQWTVRHVLTDWDLIHKAKTFFILGTSLSAFVAIIQTEFHILGYHGGVAGSEGGRALGLTTQPNIAAVTYALGLVFALGLILHIGPGRRRYRIVCMGVIAVALLLSASVSGMACALLGCFVLLFRRGLRPRTVLTIAAVFIGIYAVSLILEGSGGTGQNLNPIARIEQTTNSSSGYDTASPRIATYKAAWAGIQESPVIGHGLDTNSLLVWYDQYLYIKYPAHNFFLLIWYGGGVFFMIGMIINMIASFRRLTRKGGRHPTKDTLLAGCVVVLVFSMVSPELFDRWLWLPFVLALALPQNRSQFGVSPEDHAESIPGSADAPTLGTQPS